MMDSRYIDAGFRFGGDIRDYRRIPSDHLRSDSLMVGIEWEAKCINDWSALLQAIWWSREFHLDSQHIGSDGISSSPFLISNPLEIPSWRYREVSRTYTVRSHTNLTSHFRFSYESKSRFDKMFQLSSGWGKKQDWAECLDSERLTNDQIVPDDQSKKQKEAHYRSSVLFVLLYALRNGIFGTGPYFKLNFQVELSSWAFRVLVFEAKFQF